MSYTTHADLGGRPGQGRVIPEPEGELWHATWEPRVMALTVALGASGSWNIDMSRSARETLPSYPQLSYYEIWFAGLEKLLIQRRLVRRAELKNSRSVGVPLPLARVLHAPDVDAALARGAPTLRAGTAPAKFALGERVRTLAHKATHHTRLPAYVQGKVGTIERIHGAHVFADTNAHGLGEQPQWLYSVAFDAAQLWPDSKRPSHTVSVDAWEPYLQRCEDGV